MDLLLTASSSTASGCVSKEKPTRRRRPAISVPSYAVSTHRIVRDVFGVLLRFNTALFISRKPRLGLDDDAVVEDLGRAGAAGVGELHLVRGSEAVA